MGGKRNRIVLKATRNVHHKRFNNPLFFRIITFLKREYKHNKRGLHIKKIGYITAHIIH